MFALNSNLSCWNCVQLGNRLHRARTLNARPRLIPLSLTDRICERTIRHLKPPRETNIISPMRPNRGNYTFGRTWRRLSLMSCGRYSLECAQNDTRMQVNESVHEQLAVLVPTAFTSSSPVDVGLVCVIRLQKRSDSFSKGVQLWALTIWLSRNVSFELKETKKIFFK